MKYSYQFITVGFSDFVERVREEASKGFEVVGSHFDFTVLEADPLPEGTAPFTVLLRKPEENVVEH